ncbi:hypothetical protein DV736_g593, partial [Chaetothyriales sp. CBS 134916]
MSQQVPGHLAYIQRTGILDPQAALLSNLEVHHFLENNPPRKPEKKSGAYEPVNLQDYYNVRKDQSQFKRYVDGTSPHLKQYPLPEPFISNVVQRLKKYDLTKTEVLSMINLGLGLSRSQPANAKTIANLPGVENGVVVGAATVAAPGEHDHKADADAPSDQEDGAVEPNFRALAECVIDSLTDRFPGDEGEEKIESILVVLDECIREAKPT